MTDNHAAELNGARARISELEALLRETRSACVCQVPRAPVPAGLRTARLLHRWAALIASVFLVVMAISGIFLTHAYHLGLQPLMIQLHTGLFLGPAARVYCDVLGVSLAALAITGLYIYGSSLRRTRSRTGG